MRKKRVDVIFSEHSVDCELTWPWIMKTPETVIHTTWLIITMTSFIGGIGLGEASNSKMTIKGFWMLSAMAWFSRSYMTLHCCSIMFFFWTQCISSNILESARDQDMLLHSTDSAVPTGSIVVDFEWPYEISTIAVFSS